MWIFPLPEFLFACLFAVVNVALNKPANASSAVSIGGVAEHGNDGNIDNRHRKQFCVETTREAAPWWKVDLLAAYEVFGVQIYGNADTGTILIQNNSSNKF